MSITLEGLYKDILSTGWLVPNERGEIQRNLDSVEEGLREPFTMLEKQVALPTRENLNRSGRDNLLIFHPLLEGVIGGESPVIGKLRRAYGIRFTYAATALYEALLTGANHSSEHSKFSPDQMRILKVLNNVDEKTLKLWSKITDLSIEKNTAVGAFATVQLSRNDTLGGQNYTRLATVRFPIYEELIRNDDKIFGTTVQISQAQRANLIKMFEFIYPNIGLKDAYSVGSNSRVAPYLDVLLQTFARLFATLNNLYDEFSTVMTMDTDIRTEIDWYESIRDIESLKNLAQSVPQQYGNYPVKVGDEERAKTGSTPEQINARASEAHAERLGQAVAQAKVSATPYQEPRSSGYTDAIPKGPLTIQGAQNTHQTPQFEGLGRPLAEANGGIVINNNSLQAVIVDNNQSRQMMDPIKASIEEAVRAVRQGGVGRVSIMDANSAPTIGTGLPLAGNQPNNGVNNNGWVSDNNNNGWTGAPQQPSISTAVMMRELAFQRITGSHQAYANNNPLSGGSAI